MRGKVAKKLRDKAEKATIGMSKKATRQLYQALKKSYKGGSNGKAKNTTGD